MPELQNVNCRMTERGFAERSPPTATKQLHLRCAELSFNLCDDLETGALEEYFEEIKLPIFCSEVDESGSVSKATIPVKSANGTRMKIGDERGSTGTQQTRKLRGELARIGKMGEHERRQNYVGGLIGEGGR